MPRTALRLSIAAGLLGVACETPIVTPVAVQPITPRSGEGVVVDQSILIVDNSGSISRTEQFPHDKAMTQSLVAAMPDGEYQAGAIAFGGFERQAQAIAPFDRAALSTWASNQTYLEGGTPLYEVLANSGLALEETQERAAITVVTDGLPTDPESGRVREEYTLEVADKLADDFPGELCIHTIQVGDDPYGATFLQKLSKVTGCGSYRSVESLSSAAAIEAFQRQVYFGPVVAVAPADADGDGVPDGTDQCPRTPKGVRADARGCWVAEHLLFAHDSAEIEPSYRERLVANGLPIFAQNPDLRVSIDGHTDSSGNDAYNEKLSQRRAEAVRAFFIANGVAPERLEAHGYGETRPAAANDTPENMHQNRRVEFTPL